MYRHWVLLADNVNIRQESVAPPGNRFDETRLVGGIPQGIANLADRLVEAMVKINDRVRPKVLAHFLACDHLPGPLQQHREQAKRLLLQADAPSLLGKLATGQIRFEGAEPEPPRRSIHL